MSRADLWHLGIDEELDVSKGSPHPRWWSGPIKTTGVLPKAELDQMANAETRFLDPVTGCLEES